MGHASGILRVVTLQGLFFRDGRVVYSSKSVDSDLAVD